MRVLVTGASRGIGRAIADRLAAAGHDVTGFARAGDADFPGRFIACDLGDPAALAAALGEAGDIDGIVNNAGINVPQALEAIDLAAFDRVIGLNTRAPLQIAASLTPGMRRRGFGRIVNISSRAQLGLERHSAYAASKAGLAAMAKCWALELAPHGITVNTVAPGPVATELFDSVMAPDDPATQTYLRSVPVQRIGTPQDIAALVAFLLGNEAGFITGQTVFACGGLTIGRLAAT